MWDHFKTLIPFIVMSSQFKKIFLSKCYYFPRQLCIYQTFQIVIDKIPSVSLICSLSGVCFLFNPDHYLFVSNLCLNLLQIFKLYEFLNDSWLFMYVCRNYMLGSHPSLHLSGWGCSLEGSELGLTTQCRRPRKSVGIFHRPLGISLKAKM